MVEVMYLIVDVRGCDEVAVAPLLSPGPILCQSTTERPSGIAGDGGEDAFEELLGMVGLQSGQAGWCFRAVQADVHRAGAGNLLGSGCQETRKSRRRVSRLAGKKSRDRALTVSK